MEGFTAQYELLLVAGAISGAIWAIMRLVKQIRASIVETERLRMQVERNQSDIAKISKRLDDIENDNSSAELKAAIIDLSRELREARKLGSQEHDALSEKQDKFDEKIDKLDEKQDRMREQIASLQTHVNNLWQQGSHH